jgi:uncharacterized repeat protein (TIGR03806 family)
MMFKHAIRPLLAAAGALALAACTQTQPPVSFIADGNPEKLSDWHLMAVASSKLQLNKDVVPNVNQCASCHVADVKSRQFQPIGPKARHLNRDYSYEGVSTNQLAYLAKIGYLSGVPADVAKAAPHNANWRDNTQTVDARARAYLDINCAHCHNDKGAANTTALHLNMGAPADLHLGLCKPPVAAGAGTGGRNHDIAPGKPDDSIMLYRLMSAEPGVMMPELGRGSVHKEGVALIREWIAAMKQGCNN